jgi:hypothetical protein
MKIETSSLALEPTVLLVLSFLKPKEDIEREVKRYDEKTG